MKAKIDTLELLTSCPLLPIVALITLFPDGSLVITVRDRQEGTKRDGSV